MNKTATTPTTTPCRSHDCCTPSSPSPAPQPDAEAIRERVRAGYGQIARSGAWRAEQTESSTAGCCGGGAAGVGGGCCGPTMLSADQVAAAVGYSTPDLAALPEGANMGLSCGNPTALAALRPGETVMDLGSGGGFDCFIAGPKVGAAGRVIGIDMTPDMVTKARRNLTAYRARTGLDNVEFRLGEIEHLPAPDASVDVVISNCVLNLSPDKPRVWREVARVLRRGGRVAISDLALVKPLPEAVRNDIEALVGCVAGAVLIGLVERTAHDAGLSGVTSQRKPGYVDAMVQSDDPLYKSVLAKLPAGARIGDYIASVEFTAHKPA